MNNYIFTMRNLQSIEFAEIKIPETGLVRFQGPNSNGKSILVKVLWDVLSGGLKAKERRNPLINYEHDSGTFMIEKPDHTVLHVNIARAASETFIELITPDSKSTRRYLSDKNSHELLSKFGFHYDEKRDISLNIYNTYDPLLFITTGHKVNYDVLQSATTDPKAENALIEMKRKILEINDIKKDITATRNVIHGKLTTLVVHDIDTELKIEENATNLANSIESLMTPKLPVIQQIPDITIIDILHTIDIRESIYKICPIANLENIELLQHSEVTHAINTMSDNTDINIIEYSIDMLSNDIANKLKDINISFSLYYEIEEATKKNTCPTCGRGYTNEREESVDMDRLTQVG